MSPTVPTFVTLNDRLNQAHRRIRGLEARETALLAQNRALCAVMTELTVDGHARAADLSSRPLPTSAHGDGGDGRFGPGDQVGEHTSQHLGPAARSPAPAPPSRPMHPARARPASKRGDSRMFDVDPIAATFLIVAALWLIAAVAYGRNDR